MFKIAGIHQSYFTPVTVDIPDGTGKSVAVKFKAEFKRLPQNELDELNRRLRPADLVEGEKIMKDGEVLDLVLVGWTDLKDADGATVEYNEENRAFWLDVYPVRPTLVTAFFDSWKTSKRKN